MAVAPSGLKQQSNPFLTAGQRDLLLVALNSQASQPPVGVNGANPATSEQGKLDGSTMSANTLFQSPDMDGYDFDADYDDVDFDGADLGGEMIGALPGHGEQHDKRKNPDEEDDAEEGDAKRQETQEGEKGAKKPGRKPLTNEPTTKRKAQNRAAQRAFRERKERHLKDLETKVNEMSKAHEADKHENGMLKAQVDRLQVELKEYRKRLSLNSGSVSRSPPMQPSLNRNSSNGSAQQNFQFDFPKFGELPGSQIFGNQTGSGSSISSQRHSITPPVMTQSPVTGYMGANQPPPLNRAGSSHGSVQSISMQNMNGNASHSQSPTAQQSSYLRTNPEFAPYSTNDNMHGFASTLPQMNANGGDPFGDLFSPSVLKAAGQAENYFATGQQRAIPTAANKNGGDSTAGIPDSRVFRFNSTSASDTASPSASSLSQWNMNGTTNSSCGTSPEPTHDSPANKDKTADNFDHSFTQNPYMDNAFMSQPLSSSNLATFSTSNTDNTYSLPQLDSFDPVLFGDYRESQDNILGGGDFTGGFFDDALNNPTAPYDYGSPSNLFGILQTLPKPAPSPSNMMNAPTPSRNLMAEVDKARNGGDDDYGLPTQQAAAKKSPESATKLISCNNIWNQLQSNPDFQDGKFDLDGLCSELRSKARCSESGVMVDQEHVDKALKKLSKKGEDGKPPKEVENMPPLLFEQDSWDRVLQKLGGGTV